MAPRTGADGLLRPPLSKATSTRVILVLVAALAVVLGGCGGGSDSESTEASSSPTTVSAAGRRGEKPSPAGADSSKSSGKDPNSPTSTSSQGKQAKPTAGKQGPHIRQPRGPEEPAPTPQQRAQATVASMSLSSPVLQPGPESISTLPATYTCDGTDTWPTLRWSGIPAGTAKLALLVLNVEPVNEALFFDWAVTGLDPSSTGLDSGKLPKGAIVGKNSFGKVGYSICPPGGHETYVFALYALSSSIPAKKGFDPKALREQILELSGNSGLMAVGYG